MRRATIVMLAVIIGAAAIARSQARSFVVVAHPGVKIESISKDDLKRIFLKYKTRWPDGERAKPVDQKYSAAIRSVFSQGVLGKSLAAVESYWNGRVFAGKDSPPPMMDSDSEVLEYVKLNPGAVGYVSSAPSSNGFKVLRISD